MIRYDAVIKFLAADKFDRLRGTFRFNKGIENPFQIFVNDLKKEQTSP